MVIIKTNLQTKLQSTQSKADINWKNEILDSLRLCNIKIQKNSQTLNSIVQEFDKFFSFLPLVPTFNLEYG